MRCRRSELLLFALIPLVAATEAGATIRHFDLTTEAASNAEGELELEGWLDFGRPPPGGQGLAAVKPNAMAWMGIRFGLLDNVELASFLVFEKTEAGPEFFLASDDHSGLMMWVTELRWRPVEVGAWPIDVFVQGQLFHWFESFHPTQFRITVGLSRSVGRVILAGNISVWTSPAFQNEQGASAHWTWMDASIGVSANLVETDGTIPKINLGVEAWSLIPTGVPIHSHLLHGGGFVLGPTLALARGRLWLTGHLGFQLHQPRGDVGLRSPLVGRMMLGINL